MEVLILIGLLLLIVFLLANIKANKKHKKRDKIKYKKIKGGSNIPNEISKYDKIIPDLIKVRIKPFILNIKFHNHFRDIMTAIDNMLPVQKEIFNRSNIPISYSSADYKTIKLIALDFIVTLKNQLKRLPDERNSNSGWDEALPDPNIKSGWDKFTNNIGIPSSLYEQPAKNENIYLIDIFNNEKHETEDEIRYITTLIVGKETVDDQILIKIAVVLDKRCNTGKKQKVVLEEINIIGYLSDYGDSNDPEKNPKEPFYEFSQLTKNDVINNHEILLELERNFVRKMDSVQTMLGTTEPDTRIFGSELPLKSTLESHKVTRSIVDDMKNNYF